MEDKFSLVARCITSKIVEYGGSAEDFLYLYQPDSFSIISDLAELVVQKRRNLYRIPVDYNMPMEEMIAVGNFDWTNRGISPSAFPIPEEFKGIGKTNINLELIQCGDMMSDGEDFVSLDGVLKYLENQGKRPGILPELLALGAKFPHLQLEFPIVQIGSLWKTRGGERGLYLRRGNKERGLAVIWMQFGFLKYYRIIAVKK